MDPNTGNDDDIPEPRLKFGRVSNNAKEILAKDSISCIAVHAKLMVVGTEWGNIHVLDHHGNSSHKTTIYAHSTVINQISIDSSGEYIASCSNDGKVMIFGLLDEKQYPIISLQQAIRAVAISPNFRQTSQLVTGDTRLLLVSKGLFSSHNYKILQENRTVIRNIKWNSHFIIYATDDSVFIFDMKDSKLIGIIESYKTDANSNKSVFYCRIIWINSRKFLIGWGHLVQICVIKDNPNYSMHTSIKQLEFSGVRNLAYIPKKVESLFSFMLPDLILGIVPYDNNVLVVAEAPPDANDTEKDHPWIIILEPDLHSERGYKDISAVQIPLKEYKPSKLNNVHLDKIPSENEFYIVTSKDFVWAKEREIDDRIEWLLQKYRFDKALELIRSTDRDLTKYQYKEVGMMYIDYLISCKEYQTAAKLCESILDDIVLWENVIDKFLDNNCIETLLPFIPISDNLKLRTEKYMLILEYQFVHNPKHFLSLLKRWPAHLYSISGIINYVLKRQEADSLLNKSNVRHKREDPVFLECLAILYEHNHEYEKSLDFYFRMKSNYAFDLITKRKMFEVVQDKLVFLFNYNKEKTLDMLMVYMNDIPPEIIVKILSPTPIYLFHYLDTLMERNYLASEPYHTEMVTLYADFKPEHFLSFLRRSDKYDLNAAIDMCYKKHFTKEVIFLLGRIGQSKEALKIIMKQENSVYEAINYCQENGDEDLWGQLFKYSIDKPVYIRAILENSGMDIDMKSFIKTINNKLEIPNLKDSLVILLINNEKRVNLINAHQLGKWNDIFHMINDRFLYSTKPITCNLVDRNICEICYKFITNCTNEFLLFPCSHFFHELCIKDSEKPVISCPVCGDS